MYLYLCVLYLCIHICEFVFVFLYLCVYICDFVYLDLYMCVCISVFVFVYLQNSVPDGGASPPLSNLGYSNALSSAHTVTVTGHSRLGLCGAFE